MCSNEEPPEPVSNQSRPRTDLIYLTPFCALTDDFKVYWWVLEHDTRDSIQIYTEPCQIATGIRLVRSNEYCFVMLALDGLTFYFSQIHPTSVFERRNARSRMHEIGVPFGSLKSLRKKIVDFATIKQQILAVSDQGNILYTYSYDHPRLNDLNGKSKPITCLFKAVCATKCGLFAIGNDGSLLQMAEVPTFDYNNFSRFIFNVSVTKIISYLYLDYAIAVSSFN